MLHLVMEGGRFEPAAIVEAVRSGAMDCSSITWDPNFSALRSAAIYQSARIPARRQDVKSPLSWTVRSGVTSWSTKIADPDPL
jgi:hypothetical protein